MTSTRFATGAIACYATAFVFGWLLWNAPAHAEPDCPGGLFEKDVLTRALALGGYRLHFQTMTTRSGDVIERIQIWRHPETDAVKIVEIVTGDRECARSKAHPGPHPRHCPRAG